jgi:hypothetical protein
LPLRDGRGIFGKVAHRLGTSPRGSHHAAAADAWNSTQSTSQSSDQDRAIGLLSAAWITGHTLTTAPIPDVRKFVTLTAEIISSRPPTPWPEMSGNLPLPTLPLPRLIATASGAKRELDCRRQFADQATRRPTQNTSQKETDRTAPPAQSTAAADNAFHRVMERDRTRPGLIIESGVFAAYSYYGPYCGRPEVRDAYRRDYQQQTADTLARNEREFALSGELPQGAVSGVGDPRERHALLRVHPLGSKGVLGS